MSKSIPRPSAFAFNELWYELCCMKTESLPSMDQLDDGKLRLMHAVIGVTTEAGELADVVKKYVFYHKPLTEENVENMKEEIGDILWYLSILINRFGWSFQEVMHENIVKLSKRYPASIFTPEHAASRLDKMGGIEQLGEEDGKV